jgi:hypothetical protein
METFQHPLVVVSLQCQKTSSTVQLGSGTAAVFMLRREKRTVPRRCSGSSSSVWPSSKIAMSMTCPAPNHKNAFFDTPDDESYLIALHWSFESKCSRDTILCLHSATASKGPMWSQYLGRSSRCTAFHHTHCQPLSLTLFFFLLGFKCKAEDAEEVGKAEMGIRCLTEPKGQLL